MAFNPFNKSLQKQWQCYCRRLVRCQTRASEKRIHNLRITARRLLAIIELLGAVLPAPARRQVRCCLKQHLDIFDHLRDTQVGRNLVAPLRSSFPAAKQFYGWLGKREDRQARKAEKCARRLRLKPIRRALNHCLDQLKQQRKLHAARSESALLQAALATAFKRVARLRRKIVRTNVASIHLTRIAFKTFRYMLEALSHENSCLTEEFLAELRHYQTMMGDVQDAEVLLRGLDKFARRKNVAGLELERLRRELLRRRKWLIGVYMDAAPQLRNFWPLPRRRPARCA